MVFAALVALAFVTRFYALGMDSLWLDELITFRRVQGPISRLISDSEVHHHNPAYFLLLRAWIGFGDDEAMLRAPSALFGALTIPVGYLLGRIVAGRWVATAAGVALLLNPRLVAYAQEARMYALYVFGASVAMAGLLWLVANPGESTHPLLGLGKASAHRVRWRAAAAWAACTLGFTVALYCHATAALFVLSCSLVALVRVVVEPAERTRFAVSWCITNVLTLLAYSPWVFRLARQVRAFEDSFWATFPAPSRVLDEVGWSLLYGGEPWRWALALGLAALGTWRLRGKPLLLASVWLLAILGPGLLLLASSWQPMFMHRQFLWAAVPFGVLVGAGLAAPALPAARVGLLFFALLGGAWTLKSEYYEPYTKERWRDAISFLAERARRGDKIVAASHSVKLAFDYYQTRKTAPLTRFEYRRARDLPQLMRQADARTLWVLSRSRQKGSSDAELKSRGWRQVSVKAFGKGISTTAYRRTHAYPIPSRVNASVPWDDGAPDRSGRRRRSPEVPDLDRD